MTKRELMQMRAQLIAQARGLVDAASAEGRGVLSAEERAQYDQIWDEINGLGEQIQRMEQLEDIEQRMAESDGDAVTNGMDDDAGGSEDDGQRAFNATREYRDAYGQFLRRGSVAANLRSLQADDDEAGGYLVAPQEMINRLIQGLDNAVYIRQWATVFRVTAADSLGAPSLDADPEDGDWTGEISSADEDTQMDFGKRELHPHPLTKLIKVSMKLLRKTPSVEELINQRFGYKFDVTWEKAGNTGSGAGQPLGVFTASDDGISTSRDVSSGNTTTSMTFDGLTNAKYTLKGQYWRNAKWLFHRDAVKQIAKLKNGDGQYIWRESVRVGEPDTLLGLPFYMSEYAPNTFTSGSYVGILGDFSWYWIAEAQSFSIQRLNELYARTNQIGFIGRMEADGMPVLEEAFVRVTLA